MMSSQDTLDYAQSEEESARVIGVEIDKEQMNVHELQKDIDEKNRIIAGLQQQQQQHLKDSQRLRQQAMGEQQREKDEQLRQQQQEGGGLKEKIVKDTLFG